MQNWKLLVYIHLRQLLLPIMMLNEASQTSNTQESLKIEKNTLKIIIRRLYVSLDTHYVAGEVWQCDQLLAEPVVHKEPSQHHVQVKEVGAGADQVCDNLQNHSQTCRQVRILFLPFACQAAWTSGNS